MAINNSGLMQAARGTIFIAPAKTALPAKLSSFALTADNIAAGSGTGTWTNGGHSSNGTKPTFTKDGGEITQHDTWLMEGAKSTVGSSTVTVAITSVQADKASIQQVTGGWAGTTGGTVVPLTPVTQKVAIFVLAYDSADKLSFGFYAPEADSVFDAFNLSGDDFIEFSYNASVKPSESLKKGPNGEVGAYQLFGPDEFK